MTTMIRLILASAVFACLFVAPSAADAKAQRVASYSVKDSWPTAVRFLRIDLGYKIVERDAEAGYVLFEYEKDDKTYRGSLELVRTTDHADRDATKLIMEITERPEYEEAWVLEKMVQRLRQDLGQPKDKPEEKEPEPKKPAKPEKGEKPEDGKSD